MEIYIKDKENKHQEYSLWAYDKLIAEDGFRKIVEDTTYSQDFENNFNLKIQSLDLHDLEIRADERKKVVAELWEFIKEKEHFEGLKGYWGGNVLDLTLLKQKLTELKGEYV